MKSTKGQKMKSALIFSLTKSLKAISYLNQRKKLLHYHLTLDICRFESRFERLKEWKIHCKQNHSEP